MVETGDMALGLQLHSRDQQLVRTLVIGLRTAELHDPNNAVMQSAMSDLHSALLARLGDAPSVTVSARNQCLFVDRERLRVTPSDYLNVRYLMAQFDRWALPALCFKADVTMEELGELLVFLGQRESAPDLSPPWERSGGIAAEAPPAAPDSIKLVDETLRVFSSAIAVSRSLYDSLEADGHRQLRSLRHVTQTLVDFLIQDESALLSMTTIKNFDGYLLNHSANVAVLAAALGQRLGLPKARLGELCLAALLHDLGKTLVPTDILEKTDPLTDEDWTELRRHPVEAVEILLEQGYLGPGILSAIVAGFEHHLDFDLGGYPKLANKHHRLTLVGRIIAIADCYDAITTPRPYRTVNLTPFDGIRFLIENMGRKFDPILVKMFIELLGVYPIGTMVRLSNGEEGVVFRSPSPGAPLDRPLVRIVRGARSGQDVDLAEVEGDGTTRLAIVRVINPDNRGLLPALDMSVLAGQSGPRPD
jgi:HD-GYP domain-containing protein (c-di-GMP phosphodiesterase class II)